MRREPIWAECGLRDGGRLGWRIYPAPQVMLYAPVRQCRTRRGLPGAFAPIGRALRGIGELETAHHLLTGRNPVALV